MIRGEGYIMGREGPEDDDGGGDHKSRDRVSSKGSNTRTKTIVN